MFYVDPETRYQYGRRGECGLYFLFWAFVFTGFAWLLTTSDRYIIVDDNTNTSIRMSDRPLNTTLPLKDRPWTNWYFAWVYENTEPDYFPGDYIISFMVLFGYLLTIYGTLFYCCTNSDYRRKERTLRSFFN